LAVVLAGLLFLVGASSIGPTGCELSGGEYLGTEVCLSCHDGRVAANQTLFRASAHYMIGCEACHGAGLQHVHDGGATGLYIDVPLNNFGAINAFCMRCHTQEAADYSTGAHAQSGQVTCLDCHDVHTYGETRTSFKNNRLCLQCHKKAGFGSTAEIEGHTWHTVDPSGTGTSRCTTCHMPPALRKNQSSGAHRHSLIPLPPITSNEAADAGVSPGPPVPVQASSGAMTVPTSTSRISTWTIQATIFFFRPFSSTATRRRVDDSSGSAASESARTISVSIRRRGGHVLRLRAHGVCLCR